MKVLLLGAGGREHALGWAIRRSRQVGELFFSSGPSRTSPNSGLEAEAQWVPLDVLDPAAVAAWVDSRRVDLVVVGPESPLVAGVADELERRGVPVFGPSGAAARLEGSKIFAKRFMERHGVPTARFEVFDSAENARHFLASGRMDYPLVVKADGLAAGKGVSLCASLVEALQAVEQAMVQRAFGASGERIVIEEMLRGHEASFFVLSDGRRAVPLETCQDYKRLLDGDLGPNTGGMGGFSPSPFLDARQGEDVMRRIVEPTLAGLATEGLPYRGVLYVGLMLTGDGPMVLEYNVRFGDPEAQALMPRLESDIVPLLLGAARGELGAAPPRWKREASVCVVLTSEGYPGTSRTGLLIEGLERAAQREEVTIFHAGTRRREGGETETAGGRVLAVVALGATLDAARRRAYAAAGEIRFEGRHLRTDIAAGIALSSGITITS